MTLSRETQEMSEQETVRYALGQLRQVRYCQKDLGELDIGEIQQEAEQTAVEQPARKAVSKYPILAGILEHHVQTHSRAAARNEQKLERVIEMLEQLELDIEEMEGEL